MSFVNDIWVTSDTHFGHHNIIDYCDRPFKNAQHMNEMILNLWNETVKPGDKVYHLGDVYFSGNFGNDYWKEFFPKLNGKKRLILGNHDSGEDQILRANFKKMNSWQQFGEHGLLLTHVPVHPSSLKETFRNNKKQKWMNIHGHTHLNGEPDGDTKNYKCVCVELTNYKPVHIEELIALYLETRE